VVLLLWGLTGCGAGGPETYPVEGSVVFKDGDVSRLVGGRVEFQSVDDPDVLASADIEEGGSFSPVTLKDGRETPGLLEGTHRVCVLPPEDEEEGRPIIDRRFQDFETSGLQYTAPGDEELVIEVTRPRRRGR